MDDELCKKAKKQEKIKSMSQTEEMRKVKEQVIACQKCPLYKTRTLPVIGQGNHSANVVFVGEAPGANEDRTGFPFCGASGKILDNLLDFIGLARKDVYICNLLKCRPPANRDPKLDEINICSSFLEQQLEIIKPKVVCPLGRHSMYFLMQKYGIGEQVRTIGQIHGQMFKPKNTDMDLNIIPFYHPAVAVYNRDMLSVLQNDFLILKNFAVKAK